MRGTIAVVSVVALLSLSGLGIQAFSQQSAPVSQPAGCCAMCMNMMKGGQMGPEMMQKMGMKPETMERMQLLMRTPIFLDAPSSLHAQADKLGLNEDQKKKLGEIENEAREKARAVLTPEQRAKLGNVPDKPVTMMETCPMSKMMGDGPMKGQMMCPMMGMMGGGAPAKDAAPQPSK
jgi:hypothetical protein